MSKKTHFRGPFDNQHGKWEQTVQKSDWYNFYDINWSMWKPSSYKKSLLIIGKISGLFFNTLSSLMYFYWSMWRQLNWKKSLLVICKIFGLFLNTLTVDHNFCLLNRDKSTHPIQMQLSKKEKGQFFSAFLKSN